MKKTFFFKEFAIDSNNCGMPVSTDGILLGSWAQSKKPKKILDIGTGTGLLALMMAQRFSEAEILAIDIDEQAIAAASKNIAQSPWHTRISLVFSDIQQWENSEQFDLIICNPPYFTHGQASIHSQRATARHSLSLPHLNLIKILKEKLCPDGNAHLILPVFEAQQFIQAAEKEQLYCFRLTQVKTTENKEISRYLFSLCHQKGALEPEELVIHADGGYSRDFIQLTKAFYLKM